MKKLFFSMAIASMMAVVSCGPSAEELAAKEKAKQDSIAAADAAAKAEADAKAAADAAAAAEAAAKATADSIAAAAAAAAATPAKKAAPKKTIEQKVKEEAVKATQGKG